MCQEVVRCVCLGVGVVDAGGGKGGTGERPVCVDGSSSGGLLLPFRRGSTLVMTVELATVDDGQTRQFLFACLERTTPSGNRKQSSIDSPGFFFLFLPVFFPLFLYLLPACQFMDASVMRPAAVAIRR